eukprot:6476214-Amphidinium_carterae.1
MSGHEPGDALSHLSSTSPVTNQGSAAKAEIQAHRKRLQIALASLDPESLRLAAMLPAKDKARVHSCTTLLRNESLTS